MMPSLPTWMLSLLGLPVLVLSVTFLTTLRSARAFTITNLPSRMTSTKLFEGQLEQIEFKIFPDGRVEEIVRGVKGNNCNKVTEKINQALGEVVATQPTEEMFEQELVIDNTLTQTLGDVGGGTSWEGQSTW